MANKKIQKAFYLSSEFVKQFIESRIGDLAIQKDRSSSYIIEELLLNGLLPKNEEAKHLIQNYLYSEKGADGVKRTLSTAFQINSAGVNWNSRHSNFKPIVDYCLKFGASSATCNNTKDQLNHFYSNLKMVVERIENCTQSCIEPYDRDMYESKTEWAKDLLKKAEENPKSIVIREHFELVRDCWDMLSAWSMTYRYLADLAKMGKFQEDAVARNELYEVIDKVSKEW